MAATESAPRSVPARRLRLLVDAVLVAGIVALLLFPILAKVEADGLPVEAPPRLAPLPADARPAALRDLPVGLAPGGDLDAAAAALLGERNGARLLELVRGGDTGVARQGVYPYRYPTLEPLLPETFTPAQAAAATDLGARLILLEADPAVTGSAAPAAFALLDRARQEGACEPALNLLLLVASDMYADDRIVAREGERAWRACPGDPTAGWLLGQFQSSEAVPHIGQYSGTDDPASALATFERLVREHPGSAAAWAGQADALVRAAATTRPDAPWIARRRYERALAGYRRAARLSPGAEIDMGLARALAGLGRADEAAELQRRVVAALPSAPPAQAQHLVYLEDARDFAGAAAAAERLQALAGNAPSGPGLFPNLPVDSDSGFEHEDVHGPISLGAGRFVPLSVLLQDPGSQGGGSSTVVEDLSFIPVYRATPGVTGSDRWCADWSRRRDLVLAGRPAEALAGIPARFKPLPGHPRSCEADLAALYVAGIARLELGERPRAEARAIAEEQSFGVGGTTPATGLADERQNLWRWAGDLGRAERAAREWAERAPLASLPVLRLAEIEFLRGRYDDAVRHFGVAARRAREGDEPDVALETRAMLDRGAALRAPRPARGGPRGAPPGRRRRVACGRRRNPRVRHPPPGLVATSYYARVQLAEAARESNELPAAAEAYAAAREPYPSSRTAARRSMSSS